MVLADLKKLRAMGTLKEYIAMLTDEQKIAVEQSINSMLFMLLIDYEAALVYEAETLIPSVPKHQQWIIGIQEEEDNNAEAS